MFKCRSLSCSVRLGIIVLTKSLRERIKTRMIYVQQSLVVQHQAFFMRWTYERSESNDSKRRKNTEVPKDPRPHYHDNDLDRRSPCDCASYWNCDELYKYLQIKKGAVSLTQTPFFITYFQKDLLSEEAVRGLSDPCKPWRCSLLSELPRSRLRSG